MAKATTAGQLLVNHILPEDMQDYNRVLDKKGLSALLSEVAQKHPDDYRRISYELGQIGRTAAFTTGGFSFGLKHMHRAQSGIKRRAILQGKIDRLLDDDNLDDDTREKSVIKLMSGMMKEQQDEIYKESADEDNPLAHQLSGAGRGSKMSLASLRGSDGLYQDHRDQVIPIPVLRSYSQGLSPAEYWASTYGARLGVLAVKFATSDSGFLAKQLSQISHRLIVTDHDAEKEPATLMGLPVDVNDDDSEGSLLAAKIGPYPRDTELTPKILRHIRELGHKRMLVRSPAVSGSPSGGLYAKDVGVREFGRLPVRSENVGLGASQALSEPLSQGALSTKHSGGVAGESKSVSGFDRINSLIQVPKTFKGGAAHSTVDGDVQGIEPAPAGGVYATINGEKHYIGRDYKPTIKKGDVVEAGDVISDGVPNPALITKYKGIGEGRRYFINAYKEAMTGGGLKSNRRNIEILAHGLINHVRMTDEAGDLAPDDVVPYSTLEHAYEPREGFKNLAPKAAVGMHLERPYLHYTIGTKVRPSMLKDFDEFGIKDVDVHPEPPPFEPEMVRGMSNLQHDPDWMTRMFGSGLKSSLLRGVHRGATSDELGTSFVPGRAKAVSFGQVGLVKTPKAPKGILK